MKRRAVAILAVLATSICLRQELDLAGEATAATGFRGKIDASVLCR